MKKLLAAGLVTTAVLATAPTAMAEETFSGRCHVSGVATFGTPLKAQQSLNTYDFLSGKPSPTVADTTLCNGTLNGVDVTSAPAVAAVSGQGNLSCEQSQSTEPPGRGTLTFTQGNVSLGFTLAFVAFGTEVVLDVKGVSGGEGTGRASFAAYTGSPLDALAACNGAGIKSLGFDADFQSLSPLKSPSPAPAPAGGGGNPSGTGGGGGGSGTRTGPSGGGGPVASAASLRTVAQKLRTALRKGLAVRLAGNVPARASLKALLDARTAKRYGLTKGREPVVVARGVVALTQSGQRTGYLRLTSAAKRKLRKARRLRLQVTGTILDVTQRRQKVSKTVVLQ